MPAVPLNKRYALGHLTSIRGLQVRNRYAVRVLCGGRLQVNKRYAPGVVNIHPLATSGELLRGLGLVRKMVGQFV
ncbi:MAG: hypothetical protein DRI83_09710 [Bacteroidetes bacterium]|nr:MAG: hypothetical protein DRI83_09710 [Bacteroidota bacterium]